MVRRPPLLLALLLLVHAPACDSSGGGASPAAPGDAAGDATSGADADATSDAPVDPDAPPADAPGAPAPDAGPDAPAAGDAPFVPEGPVDPVEGLWRVRVAVVEIGGIELPFQVDLQTSGDAAAGTLKATWTLRAVGQDDSDLSEVMGTAEDTPIAADGHFAADFGSVLLPGPYSPSGTPIALTLALAGQFRSASFVCGGVTGLVAGLNITLAASTFGAVPWDTGLPAPPSCAGAAPDAQLPRLTAAECPTLAAGTQGAFPSGGLSRSFELVLPAGHDPATPAPLVFAFHGLGGSADWIYGLGSEGLAPQADTRGYVLVSPQGRGLPGIEWGQASTADNPDLALFDDVLTCATAQLGVDPERVYVTGMSAGGLFTGYLTRMRPAVIAASAPMSGGLIVDYAPPEGPRRVPVMVSWGGAGDFAVGQSFDAFATALIADLAAAGHFLVTCDHGLGHVWPAAMTTPVLDFLFAHPRGVDPLPYLGGLPASFPAFCSVP